MNIFHFHLPIAFVFIIFASCNSSKNEQNDSSKEKVFLDDTIQALTIEERFFVRSVQGNELSLGPEQSKIPTKELRLLINENGVMFFNEALKNWEAYDNVKYVRDRGGSLYSLIEEQEYLINNGELRVLFDDSYLMYDYNLLTSDNDTWTYTMNNVVMAFKKGTYNKGEQFVQFATIDSISCEEVDLAIFLGTDIEVSFDINSEKLYHGVLHYVRDDNSSGSGWHRNNFKFSHDS